MRNATSDPVLDCLNSLAEHLGLGDEADHTETNGTPATPAGDYVGKILFLEEVADGNGPPSGEYLILRQTNQALYGILPVGGGMGAALLTFPLTGYRLISAHDAGETLDTVIGEFKYFLLRRPDNLASEALHHYELAALRLRELVAIQANVPEPIEITVAPGERVVLHIRGE
jgi:hypothetical protein